MKHSASSRFWACYRALPPQIQAVADKNFELLRRDPSHPSLQFKNVGKHWSARVGARYRSIAVAVPDGYVWVWIGTHAEYDRMLR